MKKFHFRLEKILELKKYHENQWEIKLGEVTGRCETVKHGIHDLDRIRNRAFLDRDSSDSLHMSVTENYLSHLDMRIRDLRSQLVVLEKERESVQEKFLEASRERKVYDKLKERRAIEFRKEELKREYNELDDLNNSAAARHAGE